MTRDGRSKWAIAGSIVLLLVTIGLAALVAHYKNAQSQINLGQAELYDSLGLRIRWPQDWQAGSPERIANGQAVIALGPHKNGRQLILFRTTASARGSLMNAVRLASPGAAVSRPERLGSATLANEESDLLALALEPEGSNGNETLFALANLTITPNRQILGLVLLTDELKDRDRRLLALVSQSVSLQDNAGPADTQDEQQSQPEDKDEQQNTSEPRPGDRSGDKLVVLGLPPTDAENRPAVVL